MPPAPPRTLYRIRPRGFCAGVVRAIEIVDLALKAYGAPIYVLHEIVHNRYVVEDLAAKGAVLVNRLEEVPFGARLIFSAHGVSPEVRAMAAERQLRVIDATCPLVTKVHLEAIRFAREGYSILLIGDQEHDEVEGTSGEAPEVTQVVSSVAEAERVTVPDPNRVVYLTQTTLSQYDTAEIIARLRQRFPAIKGPPADDICYATQNRQEAVETVGRRAELVLVVGSANSANSNRLVEVAQRAGARAYLIEDENAIDAAWLKEVTRVALTAGASAPDVLVERVSQRLQELGFANVEDVEIIPEDVRFTLPSELVPFAVVR
ncbi:MAG TPA: 4-hydroxy-3-methylbut-2-enyl diphosphate reductase [Candidatus Xenobia bacterium]|nr:4-hydroxy-3-methylbut-2-enyl diphosphate reductase [Candidatus Xenobia bacterium]